MGRAPCCDKANVKRGPWSPEEDNTLKTYLQAHGTGGNWIALPRKAGLRRCGKSCRLRWLNYLRPDIKHGGFTDDEDHIICNLYNQMGSRWSVIASQLPGRTDNDVKNYWNTKLKKKLLAGKISLTTHAATTTTSNGPVIPTNNATVLPGSDSTTPSLLLQRVPNSCHVPKVHETLDSSFSTNSEPQNSSTLLQIDNPGLITVHDQRLPLQYDPSPRIMDFSADKFGHVKLTKDNMISHIYNDVSSSQDGSSYNGCDVGYTAGDTTGSTMMDFSFGLPYDIIDGVSFD